MGDFGEKKGGLNMLQIKPVEELIPDATDIIEQKQKELDEERIFQQKDKPMVPKPTNNDKIHLENAPIQNEVLPPSKPVKKTKRPRKPMSDAQREALRKGREKSLAIRRAKKLEREKAQAEKRRLRDEKRREKEKVVDKHEELIYNNKKELKEANNPFKDVTHFFSMMEKYEEYKAKKQRIKNQQQPKPKPKPTKPKQNPVYLPKETNDNDNGYNWYFN